MSAKESYFRHATSRRCKRCYIYVNLWFHTFRHSPWSSSPWRPFRQEVACSTFSSSSLLCSSNSEAKLTYAANTSLRSCFTACHQYTGQIECVCAVCVFRLPAPGFFFNIQTCRNFHVHTKQTCTWTWEWSLRRADWDMFLFSRRRLSALVSASWFRRSFPKHWQR